MLSKTIFGILTGLVLILFSACGGNSDPHGLNGMWEDGRGRIFHFDGDNVTDMRYFELMTQERVTEQDLSQGGFWHVTAASGPLGMTRVMVSGSFLNGRYFEILSQETHNRYRDIWVTYARIIFDEGTFTMAADGRIEFNWNHAGIQVSNFSRTESTIDVGQRQYIRR